MNVDSIKDYARYNLWANKEIAPYLEQFSSEAWNRKDDSSFGSIVDTVIHIYWAELLWTNRLNQEPAIFEYPKFQKDKEYVIEKLIRISEQFTQYVIDFSDEELLKSIEFSSMDGGSYHFARHQMIHHCINHSTYHRGQLILMMRNSGMKSVPSTNYISFLNDLNGQS